MSAVREKPHRLPQSAYAGPVVTAFTICTAERVPYFNEIAIVKIAETAMEESFLQHAGHAGVYLFMPDHLHLIVSTRDPKNNLLALVSAFKQKTAFRLHKAAHEFAWQKDFYDHIIRCTEDYGAQVRYLLRNPVRRGLCARWEQWPFKGVLGQTWEQLATNLAPL